ncbi:MAG: FtsX-like permease family protein, partial [Calditrichaeota bacterium]
MLRNNLKMAMRKLKKDRLYAFINVGGLAMGLAIALVVLTYARDKFSYDRYLPNVDRLYRVIQTGFAATPPGLARALGDRYPEFEKLTVVSAPTRHLFKLGQGKSFYLKGMVSADEHFLDVFRFPLLQGNPKTVLAHAGQMFITQSLAKRLFGDRNPVGEKLLVDNRDEYQVSGVMADVPENTHFRFQAVLSFTKARREERFGNTVKWFFYGDYIYALLRPNVDIAALEKKMSDWANREHPLQPKNYGLYLQPVTEIHLHSHFGNEISPQSDIRYIYFFVALALVVVGLVSINYMNLATARAISRSKEVGIRKVIGARRGQLVRQFLGESILLSCAALPLAWGLAEVAGPWLNRWAGTGLLPTLTFDWPVLLEFLTIVLLVGIVSGGYPALYLASLRPALILRRAVTPAGGGGGLRKILVVAQFTATVVLICATLAIHAQIEFIHNKRLGFEKDYVVTFTSYSVGESYPAFKQTLLQSPYILSVSSGSPLGIGYLTMSTTFSSAEGTKGRRLGFLNVDYDYLQTFGLRLKKGRTFSRDHPSDRDHGVILNETAAKLLGLADDPVGKDFKAGGDLYHVVGMVADFHNRSLRSPVQPIAFALSPGPNWTGLVRLDPQNVQAGLHDLRWAWEKFVPERPFEYAFLSDRIARQYAQERRLSQVFTAFSGLAVLLACMGLFGLAAFAAERRTKEIGIRKVLGATVANVVALLSKDFVKLVLLANLLGWPVAW